MDKITAQVGQIIEVNGKQYRATESGFELITVMRGPLGGELKRIIDLSEGQKAYIPIIWKNGAVVYDDPDVSENCVLSVRARCETNVPPRLSGERMTDAELAAEAATGNLDGRWVAVQVGKANADVILLPEGFGDV